MLQKGARETRGASSSAGLVGGLFFADTSMPPCLESTVVPVYFVDFPGVAALVR